MEVTVLLRQGNWGGGVGEGNREGMRFLTERGHRTERIKAARHAENEGLFTFYFFTPAAHMGI